MAYTSLTQTVVNPIAAARELPRAAAAFVILTLLMASAVVIAFVLHVEAWTPFAFATVPLLATSAIWISGGAATAVLGLFSPPPAPTPIPARPPRGKTAILVMMCREDPEPIATYLASLRKSLDRAGLDAATRIFVLSDTSGDAEVAAEEAAIRHLADADILTYRRRARNTGRKPGNIADWLDRWGDDYDYMLVLDADSRMSVDRIRRLIARMEARPRLGLLQAAIALNPGHTRFGRLQRTSARLLGPNFVRGFASWTGRNGNYWGHNALLRVQAFRVAAHLPVLSGPAPFGGDPPQPRLRRGRLDPPRRLGCGTRRDARRQRRGHRPRRSRNSTSATAAGARATSSTCASSPSRAFTPSAAGTCSRAS